MIKKMIVLFLLIICSTSLAVYEKYKIAVIGTGYVGLITGTGLAELDHYVCCVDIDEQKINKLQNGDIPIYEPGLSELVYKNVCKGTLTFSTDIAQAIRNAQIVFIAVGTDGLPDGNPDLRAVNSVVETIKNNLDTNKVICVKSTVPIGTCKQIAAVINSDDLQRATVLSNPEFLREGFAVYDFFNPTRIVVGSEFPEQAEIMRSLYAPLLDNNTPFFLTDLVSAEIIKYASNAFLAVKVAYINEIAQLCSKVGANVNAVAVGMGLDDRIGNKFLSPGPGFGGSCFPKDTIALVKKAEAFGVTLRIAASCIEANKCQKMYIVQKTAELCGNTLEGKKIAVWGLSFKANTDDVRQSAAIDIINEFLKRGALVKTYDPLAMANMNKIIPVISYCKTKEEAIENADALVILTEWQEFKDFDYSLLDQYMVNSIAIDTRSIIPDGIATKNKKNIYKLGS